MNDPITSPPAIPDGSTGAPDDQDIDPYVAAALARKAVAPVILDVRGLTSIADYFIIVGGSSTRQVSAIGESIERELKNQGIRPLSVDGVKEGQWALLDYGHVILHVFHQPVRSFYDLEGLWADARRIRTPAVDAWAARQSGELRDGGTDPWEDEAADQSDDMEDSNDRNSDETPSPA